MSNISKLKDITRKFSEDRIWDKLSPTQKEEVLASAGISDDHDQFEELKSASYNDLQNLGRTSLESSAQSLFGHEHEN